MSIKNVSNSTWLDDQGLKLGFIRFDNESVVDYRKRVLKYLNNLPVNTEKGFIQSQNIELNSKTQSVFEIHLKQYEANDFTWNVAEDPRVVIDANFFKVWSNYEENKDSPDLKIDFSDRKNGYFLEDIWEALQKLDFLEVKKLDKYENWQYLKSKNLLWNDSLSFVSNEVMNTTQITKLSNNNIRNIFFENEVSYNKEVSSFNEMDWDGIDDSNYYIDRVKGRVWSSKNGGGFCSYSYNSFPFKVVWAEIKTLPFNDQSIDHLIKDKLINENGLSERLLLNSYGARIVNEILATHSLQWGK